MKKNLLKVGQQLTCISARFLRPGDKLKFTNGALVETWTVDGVQGGRVTFIRSDQRGSIVFNTAVRTGWERLTVKKLAKGVDVRRVTKLTAADAVAAVKRAEHLKACCRNLIEQKAELRNELAALKELLNDMITASDESIDAAKRRQDVWTKVRKALNRPRLTEYQKALGKY